jgi:hypothetical protein
VSQISMLSREGYIDLQDKVAQQVAGSAALEDAAQRYMSVLYESLTESVVLARFFATVPFGELPGRNREFVMDLVTSVGMADEIKDETLVLSLLGTRGLKPDWNDRLQSRGHVGIPLVSSSFIDRIPMMSRLLKQLGAGIDWIDSNDTELVARTFENLSGVFHVRDAKTETDSQGRKIIAAQDFVEAEGIKTVFGIGGCYMGTLLFFTTVVFLRDYFEKDAAEKFMIQAGKFKAATSSLVDEGKIFS